MVAEIWAYGIVDQLVALIWPGRSIGSSCQTANMAALLNSLFFVFKISFLPKYRAIYYDYIGGAVAYNVTVSTVYHWIFPKC